jgi:hypothetical protein
VRNSELQARKALTVNKFIADILGGCSHSNCRCQIVRSSVVNCDILLQLRLNIVAGGHGTVNAGVVMDIVHHLLTSV